MMDTNLFFNIEMDIGLSTLEAECAGQGLDWEEVLEQRAREKAKLTELGLTTENSIQKEVETSQETDESGNFS